MGRDQHMEIYIVYGKNALWLNLSDSIITLTLSLNPAGAKCWIYLVYVSLHAFYKNYDRYNYKQKARMKMLIFSFGYWTKLTTSTDFSPYDSIGIFYSLGTYG